MTKQGYKDKFIKTFLFFSLGLYLFFICGSRNFSSEALIGQYIYSAVYVLIPCTIIALIWEFFSK